MRERRLSRRFNTLADSIPESSFRIREQVETRARREDRISPFSHSVSEHSAFFRNRFSETFSSLPPPFVDRALYLFHLFMPTPRSSAGSSAGSALM